MLLLALLSPCVLTAAEEKKPLNVLFLIADDLNTMLGCYEHPQAKTPNIDRLALRGVQFETAYCQFPLCNPSRTSLLTGRNPNVTTALDNKVNFRDVVPDTVTLPQLFKNNGYFTARVGKLYHYGVPGDIGTDGMDDPASWDKVVNPRGVDKDVEDEIHTIAPPDATGAKRFGGTLSWLAVPDDKGAHTDGVGAEEAVKILAEVKDKPFFLAVGFFRPHTPYVAPQKYFDQHPIDQIKLPETPQDFVKQTPPAAITTKKAEAAMTDEQRKEAIQAYLASTSYMDAQVGRVLDELDRLGLSENTIIVFTSDHGYHLGEFGMWQKQSLFEQVARVPMIIAVPGEKKNGQRSEALAELLDLYPTLADYAGLTKPDYLDGKSLRPVLNGSEVSVRSAAFTQVQRGKVKGLSVRTIMYRYTVWNYGDDGVQLYDMDADPLQSKNLANDPAYAEPRGEMQAMIEEQWPRDKWPVTPAPIQATSPIPVTKATP